MPDTVRSEPELRVFVSSVMSVDMDAPRSVAADTISAAGMVPWEFERTPPAPEEATSAYIASVARCDLFIWVTAGRTTSPVESEIAEAVRLGKPILAFVLPHEARDERSARLLKLAGDRVKYYRVTDLQDFASALAQGLADHVARAVRGTAGVRSLPIERLREQLRGKVVARWQAVGVAPEVAAGMFDDSDIGALPDSLAPHPGRPVTALIGDVGSGKTLAAMRYALDAIERRLADPACQIPAWVDLEAGDSIDAALERVVTIDDPARVGVCLVVDGADSRGPAVAARVVEQANATVASYPGSTVLLTGRPDAFRHIVNLSQVDLPLLTIDEAISLAKRAFTVEVTPWAWQGLPPAVQDAAHRPLFALLLARSRMTSPSHLASTPGQLIDALVTDSIGDANHGEATTTLELLAVLSTNASGLPVQAQDLAGRPDVDRLAATRLVTRSGSAVAFSLPLFREWFAARAIESGTARVEEIALDEVRLELWRYAIHVVVAYGSRETVNRVMGALAQRSPGFAGEVLHEAAARGKGDSAESAVDHPAVQRSLRVALDGFIDGLGPLGDMITPAGPDARRAFTTLVENDSIMFGWRADHSQAHPGDMRKAIHDHEWLSFSLGRPGGGCLWPWETIQGSLRGGLQALLRPHFLQVPAMAPEMAWLAATQLVRPGSVLDTRLPRRKVETTLVRYAEDQVLAARAFIVPLGPLRQALESTDGDIQCPYPERDRELTGFVSSGYGPEATRERTRLVYERALLIFNDLVTEFLPRFGPRLNLFALQPLVFHGWITHPDEPMGPGLNYYLEPVELGATSRFEFEEDGPHIRDVDLGALGELTRARRPNLPWIQPSASAGTLEIYGQAPASILAKTWLTRGLRRLNWS